MKELDESRKRLEGGKKDECDGDGVIRERELKLKDQEGGSI